MLSGWSCATGSSPGFGFWPVRMAGTASGVCSWTEFAFRYQVDVAASAAKFGKRPASIRWSGPSRVGSANSSRTTRTTGTGLLGRRDRQRLGARRELAERRAEEEDHDEHDRHRRQHGQEHLHAAQRARRGRRTRRRARAATAKAGTVAGHVLADDLQRDVGGERGEREVVQPPHRAHRDAARRAPRRATSASGGKNATTSAKKTTSPAVEPRTTKNSGVLPSRSNSGSANANAESTDEVQRVAPELALHLLGWARYRTRRPSFSSCVRSTSNRAASSRSHSARV